MTLPETSRSSASRDDARRSAATLPEQRATGAARSSKVEDSLFGEDVEAERGPDWCVDDGAEIKAMNKFELWLALGSGDFSPETLVWKLGRERWQPAGEVPDLACALKLHAQTLLAAARVARAESGDEPVSHAITPELEAAIVCGERDAAESLAGEDIVALGRDSLDGADISERPTEPLYLVRNLPRSRYGGRRLLAGIVGSSSAVPPAPLPAKAARAKRLEPRRALFGLMAAAAAMLLFSSPASSSRRDASPASATRDLAAAMPLPVDASDAVPPATTSQPGAAGPSVAAIPEPVAAPEPSSSATESRTSHKKSVSPSHKGQKRANRRGR